MGIITGKRRRANGDPGGEKGWKARRETGVRGNRKESADRGTVGLQWLRIWLHNRRFLSHRSDAVVSSGRARFLCHNTAPDRLCSQGIFFGPEDQTTVCNAFCNKILMDFPSFCSVKQ